MDISSKQFSQSVGKPQPNSASRVNQSSEHASENVIAKKIVPPQSTEDINTSDNSFIRPLPGKTQPITLPPGLFEKDGPQAIIEDALDLALNAKTPMARQMAMGNVAREARQMTPGQLDDLKDAIVKRMASDDTSQRERDVLKMMYDTVDAIAENRPVKGTLDLDMISSPPFMPKPIEFPFPRTGVHSESEDIRPNEKPNHRLKNSD